jgi:hypothetical protein
VRAEGRWLGLLPGWRPRDQVLGGRWVRLRVSSYGSLQALTLGVLAGMPVRRDVYVCSGDARTSASHAVAPW